MSSRNEDANIAPRPQWAFAEVVEHAWQVYVGRGIESGGRRNVLYRIWAAMVGADRAVAELDHFVTQHGNEKSTAKAVGCAVSTLRRLRRQFSLVGHEPLSPVPLELAPGEQLRGLGDAYETEARIGSGGMGVVYRVHRLGGDASFAAKLLSSTRFVITNAVRDRFMRECLLARAFESSRVVRSIECLRHRGTLVAIMELLNGTTLYDKLSLERSAISASQRYEWVHQAIEGVAYLHANGIVHRDLSPRNCLLRNDESVAVGDFGVARRVDDATVTAIHERMGSLIYISPQQRENPHASNFSDDVFALGQIAYHVLTGDSPHGGIRIISDLGYPDEMEELVSRMRSPHPHLRPQSAEHCLTELRSLDIGEDDLPLLLP